MTRSQQLVLVILYFCKSNNILQDNWKRSVSSQRGTIPVILFHLSGATFSKRRQNECYCGSKMGRLAKHFKGLAVRVVIVLAFMQN